MPPEIQSATKKSLSKFSLKSLYFVLVGLLLALISVFGIHRIATGFSLVIVGIIYIYLIAILIASALLSSKNKPLENYCKSIMITRIAGMALFAFFIVALMFSWGNIYLSIGTNFKNQAIATDVDAVYFSYVTMVTLGYGDFVPTNDLAKIYVMCQISGSILLFFAALPLLVSRIALFRNEM